MKNCIPHSKNWRERSQHHKCEKYPRKLHYKIKQNTAEILIFECAAYERIIIFLAPEKMLFKYYGINVIAYGDLPHVVIIAHQIENISSYFEFLNLTDFIKH